MDITVEDALANATDPDWDGCVGEETARTLAQAVETLRTLLREVEWAEMEGRCGVCQRFRQDGHAPDCRLHAALA